MKGLEISRAYFETYGLPMLKCDFPDLLDKLAFGLVGPGSECFGFDDAYSLDHDFEPGFIIFLPSEDVISRQQAFQLERAYAKLPQEFMGLKRQKINPAGGNRHGVIRTHDFYHYYLKDTSVFSLLNTPDYLLAEATNGDVFMDNLGEFNKFRQELLHPPLDVFKKKLCASLMMMDQAGIYNYERCLNHQEPLAASLCIKDFCIHAVRTIYLLNDSYMPYFKWMFKGAERFDIYQNLKNDFEELLLYSHDVETHVKIILKNIQEAVIAKYNIKNPEPMDLQRIAFIINDTIENPEIRNLDIFYGIN